MVHGIMYKNKYISKYYMFNTIIRKILNMCGSNNDRLQNETNDISQNETKLARCCKCNEMVNILNQKEFISHVKNCWYV